jgi:hypothetical protein
MTLCAITFFFLLNSLIKKDERDYDVKRGSISLKYFLYILK